jgi:hypothetical protein
VSAALRCLKVDLQICSAAVRACIVMPSLRNALGVSLQQMKRQKRRSSSGSRFQQV